MQQWFQCVPNILTAITLEYALGYMLLLILADINAMT
jgi:hypothetical protein